MTTTTDNLAQVRLDLAIGTAGQSKKDIRRSDSTLSSPTIKKALFGHEWKVLAKIEPKSTNNDLCVSTAAYAWQATE